MRMKRIRERTAFQYNTGFPGEPRGPVTWSAAYRPATRGFLLTNKK